LKEVSATMQKVVSENGYVGRYGGDEFVVILNNTSYHESKLIFDCLRQEIQDIKAFEAFYVTISGGLSRFYPTDEIDDVLNRADKMLYRAKSKSKNYIMLES
jgi:diguanylate cyclase (GGDEF)-like protein